VKLLIRIDPQRAMKVDSTRGSSNWNRIHRYAIGHFAGIKRIPTLVGWNPAAFTRLLKYQTSGCSRITS
jgi:hypothetical protein